MTDHCLRSRDYVNVIVADKQPHLVYLDMDSAVKHCTKGIGVWDWASMDGEAEPDVVLACARDIPTMEAVAATAILRHKLPTLKLRFVNVVDLLKLMPDTAHPQGLKDAEFNALFTVDKPVIFSTFMATPHSCTSSFTTDATMTTCMFMVTGKKEASTHPWSWQS